MRQLVSEISRWRKNPSRALTVAAVLAMAALALLAVFLLGGFHLMAIIEVGNRLISIPNTFATVDHPFHATRAQLLLEQLQHGHILRWIGSHHGGYPVEFYPLGAAWLDVALWAALLGTYPIIAIHKLGVIVVFLSPGIAFWILGRGDRLNPFVPLLALAIHLAVPGLWWSGGYLELIEWGLVSNVGGAALALIALASLGRYVLEEKRGFAVLAIVASSGALYTNMRSGIAIGVSALAILLAVTYRRDPRREPGIASATLRISLVAIVAILLTAPLLVAMAQYSDLYFFVHFLEYDSILSYWHAIVASVSWWFIPPAIIGIAIALACRTLPMMRMVGIATLIYTALTVLLSQGGTENNLIRQLETPRLMPFQRLLLIYLAAAALGWLIEQTVARLVDRPWREIVVAAALTLVAVFAVNQFAGTFHPIPDTDLTAPRDAHTTGVVEFAQFTDTIAAANHLRPDGTAILVVGDQESWWHEQLWSPSVGDGLYFYDDWMWYWQPDRRGPYSYERGHYFPNPSQIFTSEWLGENAISVLVVTNMTTVSPDPRRAAETNALLAYQQTIGYWDIYTVRQPVSIMTNGDLSPITATFSPGNMRATFDGASGEVLIRHNWFPRWRAWADGREVDIARTMTGTMSVTVPAGTEEIVLRYGVTTLDWVARVAVAIGFILLAGVATGSIYRARRIIYPISRS